MARIHAVLESIILDPTDNDLYADLDHYCYLVWEWCLLTGHLPWGWCADRYCSCKVALSEHEPDTLPGLPHLLADKVIRPEDSRLPRRYGPNAVDP
jgi:hypothetical protein